MRCAGMKIMLTTPPSIYVRKTEPMRESKKPQSARSCNGRVTHHKAALVLNRPGETENRHQVSSRGRQITGSTLFSLFSVKGTLTSGTVRQGVLYHFESLLIWLRACNLKKQTLPIAPSRITRLATRYPGSLSKFSATRQRRPLGLYFASYSLMSAMPPATSLAMGFSLRTCLPAASDWRMTPGCVVIGSATMTEEISERARRASRLAEGSLSW